QHGFIDSCRSSGGLLLSAKVDGNRHFRTHRRRYRGSSRWPSQALSGHVVQGSIRCRLSRGWGRAYTRTDTQTPMVAEAAESGATMDQDRILGGWRGRRREGGRLRPVDRSRTRRRTLVLERLEERVVMSSTWVSQFPGPIINTGNSIGNTQGITSPDG